MAQKPVPVFETHRQQMALASPSWLQRTYAWRVLYAIALHLDAIYEMLVRAIKLRYPNVYSNETLPIMSQERQIIRGKYETDAQHGERLDRAWQSHSVRGGPYELLNQIWHHYRPSAFTIDLLYPSGAHFQLNATTGEVARDAIAFTEGFPSTQWARWFAVYQWPTAIDDDGLWDDAGTWDDGGVWDYDIADLTAADVADLRSVPTAWNNEHCLGQLILLGPGAELWDLPEAEWDAGSDQWDLPGGEAVIVEIR